MKYDAPQQRRHALPQFSEHAHRLGDFTTVGEALDYAARGEAGLSFYSGRGALIEKLTYRDLREQALAIGRRLLRLRLKKGERLAIVAETSADFVRVFCGAQYTGIVPVPLPLPSSFGGRDIYVAQLRRLLERAGAVGLLSPPDLLATCAVAASGLPMKLVASFAELAAAPEGDHDAPAVGADDLCYVQFSSGSTRHPVGVAVPQRALMTNAAAISRWGLRVTPSDRCVSWLPFFHDLGLVGFFLTPLAAQLSVDYLPTQEFARRPLLWLSLLSRSGATISYSPTFGYELCARRAETSVPDELDLSRWRVAGIGGEMISPRVLDRFARVFGRSGFRRNAFLPSYGLAEATLAVSFAPLNKGIEVDCVDAGKLHADRAAVPAGSAHHPQAVRDFVVCGRPLPGLSVEIREDQNQIQTERRIGRIFVKGSSVITGNPGETNALTRSAPFGWLDTGDLGYWLDGALVIVGRAKDLIIVNGRNIPPQDLELASEQVPGVRSHDVAAFSVYDIESGGERVILLVECRIQEQRARADLVRAIADAVRPAAMVECEVVLIPRQSLPHTSSGKLSRIRAKRMFLQGAFRPHEANKSHAEPTTSIPTH
jgi:fatty-acyl-CoA synthase